MASSNCQTLTRISIRCKDLGDICCTSQGIAYVVLNFVAMATRFGWGKIQSAAFDGQFPKTHQQMQKNLTGISYTSQVIANFVPNFVAMATGVSQRGKCDWQHSMADSHNPPTGAKISYTSRVIAHFVPNFVATATGVGRGKCDWQHSMAHPRKPPYKRKNLTYISVSYTHLTLPTNREV